MARKTNVTVIRANNPGHGETNPNWRRYSSDVWAGRGANAEQVRMVIVSTEGDAVTGYDARGRYITVSHVKGQTMAYPVADLNTCCECDEIIADDRRRCNEHQYQKDFG